VIALITRSALPVFCKVTVLINWAGVVLAIFCAPKSRDAGLTVIAGALVRPTAVPESATTAGPFAESLDTVREPATAPDAAELAGTNATWMGLLSPGRSVAGSAGAEMTEKFALAVNAVNARLKLPELVTATDCETLAFPAGMRPKSSVWGAKLMVLLILEPVPLRATVCGIEEPLCDKLRVPARVPPAVGAKTI